MCREQVTHAVSPTGRSRMSGMATQEEGGLPQTLSSALRDGDHVECIIRETGLNQDGRTTGITMPSTMAQVLRLEILKRPKPLARHSSHVKAATLHVGSIKPIIGHSEGTAGLTGARSARSCLSQSLHFTPWTFPTEAKARPAPPSYHGINRFWYIFFPGLFFMAPRKRTMSTLLFFFRYLFTKKKNSPPTDDLLIVGGKQ